MRADILTEWASRQKLMLTDEQLDLLSRFQERLLTVNTYMNLTAITDEADIAVKHFIDSLTLLPWITPEARVIDVGAGAGFPGLPLKIVRPDIKLTLLDSLRKRILFLQETVEWLGLTGVECIHARAEELERKDGYRGGYDQCTARAVTRMEVLAGYTLPFLKRGGRLLAMKGPDIAGEMAEAERSLTRYGGKPVEIKQITLAPGLIHSVAVIEKIK